MLSPAMQLRRPPGPRVWRRPPGNLLARRLPDVPAELRHHGEEQGLPRRLDRLLCELDRKLDSGALERDEVRRGYRVWAFGAVGYRVDRESRQVQPCFRYGDSGILLPQRVEVELYRPLSTHRWLVPMLRRLGLSERSQQHHLFLSDAQARQQDDWIVGAAWERVRCDARFLRLRSEGLPKALGLDPALLAIALASRTYPRGSGWVNSSLFNRVWKHERSFRQVARENPRLLPLFSAAVRKDLIRDSEDPVAGLRRCFLEAGLSKASWRYVVRHGARIFRLPWTIGSKPPMDVALRWMRRLQSAGLPPPPPPFLAGWLASYTNAGGVALGNVLYEARKAEQQGKYEVYRLEARRVLEWLHHAQPRLDKLQARAGWPWLLRTAEVWHRRKALAEVPGPRTWTSAIREQVVGRHRIVPLVSVESMIEEALAMRNCLVDLIVDCQVGNARYFSIRDGASGTRIAVVELRLDQDKKTWSARDVKGPLNTEVPPAVKHFAASLAGLYELCDTGPREFVHPDWLGESDQVGCLILIGDGLTP